MKKYCVDIYPSQVATNLECLKIELELERLVGGLWDEVDVIGGRTRYRQGFFDEADAVGFAKKFKALELKAELVVVAEILQSLSS